MAQDVWLPRMALITCVLLSVLAGNTKAADGNRMQALDMHFFHPKTAKETNEQERKLSKNRKSIVTAMSQRKFHLGEPPSENKNTTMQINHDFDKEVSKRLMGSSRRSLRKGKATKAKEEGIGLEKLIGHAESSNKKSKRHNKYSVEGGIIIKAASILGSSLESQVKGIDEPVKFSVEKVGNRVRAFQYFLPIQNTRKSKQSLRYKYVNSLLGPQLAGIQADLNGLDTRRRGGKTAFRKASRKGFKSVESGTERESLFVGGSRGDAKAPKSDNKKKKIISTEKKIEQKNPAVGPSGQPSDLHELSSLNSQEILILSGSGEDELDLETGPAAQPSHRSPKDSVTLLSNQSMISELAFGDFQETALEDSIHSWEEDDSKDFGEDISGGEIIVRPSLVSQTGKNLKANAQGKPSPQSLRHKAMKYIQAKSQYLDGEQFDRDHNVIHPWEEEDSNDFGEDLSGGEFVVRPSLVSQTGKNLKANSQGKLSPQLSRHKAVKHIQTESQNLNGWHSGGDLSVTEIQRVSPFLPFGSAKVRSFPKITVFPIYKRTGVPRHNPLATSGSGEGSGSGENDLPSSTHFQLMKLPQRTSTKESSAKNKTHTGIVRTKKRENRKKCSKKGKPAVRTMSILALGDSLTNGFHSDDKSHTPYAKTLESLLNKDKHNCYILETTAKDGAEAHEMSAWLQTHLKNRKVKYSWVIILAGTNDIIHNSHSHNRRAWDIALEHIIDLHISSHRFGAKTMAVTIPEMDCEESDKPPCKRTRLERNYINEKLRHYAKTNDFTILCDLANKFPRYSLSNKERERFWEEGLHMRPAGYKRMAEIIYKDLSEQIDEISNEA
ncbi:uncharacterized protein LOC114975265 isoform X1 [Acropora millepora]|uniref:uncharacterized protein LOC114975265 isoform X1 n=1 Tax=Acropora millepora TaxID=45264 RepID=UPI001CF2735E|nr:uncharacterized protein LOC114975265 isoform X1 [Acropora millepora]